MSDPVIPDQDRAWIKLLALEVAEQVADKVIRNHIAACPWRYETKIGLLKLLLAMVGSGAVGAGAIKGLLSVMGA